LIRFVARLVVESGTHRMSRSRQLRRRESDQPPRGFFVRTGTTAARAAPSSVRRAPSTGS
jgi:hypothetical protein